jgi:hypothetical protein
MSVPCYPGFVPLNFELKEILHPRLSLTSDGVSEFTFSGLYLFRDKYKYRISRDDPESGFIISGEDFIPINEHEPSKERGKTFFMTPCGTPKQETLDALLETHDYWKNISESVLAPVKEKLEKRGFVFTEDRDNFDYLHYRKDLAQLPGKKYHKKKNHIKNFLNTYSDHEQKPLNTQTVPAALEILDRWKKDSFLQNESEGGDYSAAKEALELFDSLPLRGTVYYVGGKPAAYCLGESIARGRMFAIHFEKAIDEYKGIYQYMNNAFAASLPGFFTLINREQDLGSEGLRQAKMTYRPCDFVRKYIGIKT